MDSEIIRMFQPFPGPRCDHCNRRAIYSLGVMGTASINIKACEKHKGIALLHQELFVAQCQSIEKMQEFYNNARGDRQINIDITNGY